MPESCGGVSAEVLLRSSFARQLDRVSCGDPRRCRRWPCTGVAGRVHVVQTDDVDEKLTKSPLARIRPRGHRISRPRGGLRLYSRRNADEVAAYLRDPAAFRGCACVAEDRRPRRLLSSTCQLLAVEASMMSFRCWHTLTATRFLEFSTDFAPDLPRRLAGRTGRRRALAQVHRAVSWPFYLDRCGRVFATFTSIQPPQLGNRCARIHLLVDASIETPGLRRRLADDDVFGAVAAEHDRHVAEVVFLRSALLHRLRPEGTAAAEADGTRPASGFSPSAARMRSPDADLS